MSGPISFDRVADRYDTSRGGPARAAEFADAIAPWLPAGPVLEVGVGTGVVAAALLGRGVPLAGVDISAEMLARAYPRIGPRLARADARHLPIADACVSGVVFAMALHVVGDVPAAVAEAARVLRPSGRVVAVHAKPDAEPTDVTEALRPLEHRRDGAARPDRVEALDAAASAAGLRLAHRGWTSWYARSQAPNDVADGIEGRLWSYLWRIDDEAWERDVAPAVRALRALPSPDRPRPYRQRHRLTVYARP